MMEANRFSHSRMTSNAAARGITVIALSAVVAGAAGAQSATKVPVRQLAPATATSAEALGAIAAVRHLPNGTVLVNDQLRRRVVLMDSTLAVIGVAADSTSATATAYGARPGGLIAYKGDSTLFVDPASLSMLVLDGAGKISRVIAAPRPSDVQFLAGGAQGTAALDAQGRLIYRQMSFGGFRGMGGPPGAGGAPPAAPAFPDSSPIVRYDLAARKLDTAAFFKIPKIMMNMSQDANGRMTMSSTINPLPVIDDWAVLSDGTLAVVRGSDYHVDFYSADGQKRSAPKVAYDWQRLTDDDKVKFMDSTKVAMERMRAQMAAGGAPGGAPSNTPFGGGGGANGGAPVMVMRMEGGPPSSGAPAGGAQRIETNGPPPGGMPALNFISPSELPDYKPVFGAGSIRADMDGRLWVRTIATKATTGGAIYDVIDRTGALVDRVQVPAGAVIAGFGQGGVVYLGVRDASGVHLQRAVTKK